MGRGAFWWITGNWAPLDEEQAAELEAVAEVDGAPVAEEIRQAIADRIDERRCDEDFPQRLRP